MEALVLTPTANDDDGRRFGTGACASGELVSLLVSAAFAAGLGADADAENSDFLALFPVDGPLQSPRAPRYLV